MPRFGTVGSARKRRITTFGGVKRSQQNGHKDLQPYRNVPVHCEGSPASTPRIFQSPELELIRIHAMVSARGNSDVISPFALYIAVAWSTNSTSATKA